MRDGGALQRALPEQDTKRAPPEPQCLKEGAPWLSAHGSKAGRQSMPPPRACCKTLSMGCVYSPPACLSTPDYQLLESKLSPSRASAAGINLCYRPRVLLQNREK